MGKTLFELEVPSPEIIFKHEVMHKGTNENVFSENETHHITEPSVDLEVRKQLLADIINYEMNNQLPTINDNQPVYNVSSMNVDTFFMEYLVPKYGITPDDIQIFKQIVNNTYGLDNNQSTNQINEQGRTL